MLTKAILTGGVLSALAGCIVYFGTEGATATESIVTESIDSVEIMPPAEISLEDIELAGAPEPKPIKRDKRAKKTDVEAEIVPEKTSKPKIKWLDQFLRRSKPTATPAPVTEVEVEVLENDVIDKVVVEGKKPQRRFEGGKRKERNAVRDEATGRYIIDQDGLNDGPNFDEEIGEPTQQPGLRGSENIVVKNADVRPSRSAWGNSNRPSSIDYDLVIKEAQKLLVDDMRNQAYLEIIDYAVDNGDMTRAADVVQYLSTPALRDTARARMGTGLARLGNSEAAFSILDFLEIDELSAPIRLEIITAMMATEQERKAFAEQR